MTLRGDNFEKAELLELGVEVLAMLFRRLPRGVVEAKDAALQARVESAQRQEARSVVPAHETPNVGPSRLEVSADEA